MVYASFKIMQVIGYILIIFAVAAVLTPPDPITQIGLGIPLLIFIFPIKTIYADDYKGTTIIDGIRIVYNIIKWRIS